MLAYLIYFLKNQLFNLKNYDWSNFSWSFDITLEDTNLEISPLSFATSLTTEEFKCMKCSDVTINKVETSSFKWWFIVAIWNSNSKSDTCLNPRIRATTLLSRAKSAIKPSVENAFTLGICLVAPSINSILSSESNSGFFSELTATAKIIWSKSFEARSAISIWPRWIGSKVPG